MKLCAECGARVHDHGSRDRTPWEWNPDKARPGICRVHVCTRGERTETDDN